MKYVAIVAALLFVVACQKDKPTAKQALKSNTQESAAPISSPQPTSPDKSKPSADESGSTQPQAKTTPDEPTQPKTATSATQDGTTTTTDSTPKNKHDCVYSKAVEAAGGDNSGKQPVACGEVPKPTALDKDKINHFGETFNVAKAQALDQIIAKADEYNGKTVKVSARISKVCKKKGCWFVLADDSGTGNYVRVTMHNYGFFVPLDCDGKNAVVEGTFRKVDLPEKVRKHLAEDGKEDSSKIKGSKMELTLVARAVDIEG